MEQVIITQLTGTDLLDRIDRMEKNFENRLQDILENFQPKEPTEYLTRKEVAKLLKVDLVTLYNWNKRKILVAQNIGGRVLYSRTLIKKKLEELS